MDKKDDEKSKKHKNKKHKKDKKHKKKGHKDKEKNIPSVHPVSSKALSKPESGSVGSGAEATALVSGGKLPEKKETWGNRLEFFFSLLGFAIGLGNVWRFPFLCYKNGGGTFLIPYVFMLVFVGLPIIMLEVGIGQYSGYGPIETFREMVPIACGLGFAEVANAYIIGLYYIVILSWAFLYLFEGFTSTLPWSTCKTEGASVLCDEDNPAGDYMLRTAFGHNPLASPNWSYYGEFNGKLFGCYALAWLVVCLSLLQGIKSSGKVVYFTATFPFLVIIILFIRGITLEGAGTGIYFYLTPDFSKLGQASVWTDAATQIFFSVGCALGGNIAYSSYNKFDHPGHRDAILVALINCGFSLFSGFAVFSTLGFMAHKQGITTNDRDEFESFAKAGVALAFSVFPTAIARMPASPPAFSFLFFSMLITLGLDSMFGLVENVITSIINFWPDLRERKWMVTVPLCIVSFLLGITMIFGQGVQLLTVLDEACGSFTLLIFGLVEVLVVGCAYGIPYFIKHRRDRLMDNWDEMKNWVPLPLKFYWMACLYCITPLVLVGFTAVKIATFPGFQEGGGPPGVQAMGSLTVLFTVLMIPVGVIYRIIYRQMNGMPIDPMSLISPTDKWGPQAHGQAMKSGVQQEDKKDYGDKKKHESPKKDLGEGKV